MSKEKQILKLGEQGYSQRKIAGILSISRNTVSLVLAAAKRQHISAQDASTMTEQELFIKLFPEKASVPIQMKPNFELIHKELLRAGVTLKLLWEDKSVFWRVWGVVLQYQTVKISFVLISTWVVALRL